MAVPWWLEDHQWAAIEPLLPRNARGPSRVDDRRVISGILYVLKSGCRWQDCPSDYGPYTTIFNRFNRWSQKAFWHDVIERLIDTGAIERSSAPDSVHLRARRQEWPRRQRKSNSGAKNLLAPVLDGVEVAVIRGPTTTAFFISMGEIVSVHVSVPSRPLNASIDIVNREAKLNAAHTLLTAAAALVSEEVVEPASAITNKLA